MKTDNSSDAGFTRADLLAVAAMFIVLATLTTAAIGKAASDANSETCLNNKRQLMRALHLYAADYADYLVPDTDDGGDKSWLVQTEDSHSVDSTNIFRLIDPTTSKLAAYLSGNASIFKCPSDSSVFTNGSQEIPRVRSISINQAVGTNPYFSGGRQPSNGPWLDGAHGHTANQTWRCYGRLADVVNPSPAGLYVFLDELPLSINDGGFAGVGPMPGATNSHWIDWPAHYHNGGAGFGFMDGHAEIHVWQDANTLRDPFPDPKGNSGNDIGWLANRTSALVADQP